MLCWFLPYINMSVSGKEPAYQCRSCKRLGFDPWFGKIAWRRKWQHTPIFLLRESHGQRSLVGYGSQGYKELYTTEATWHAFMHTYVQGSNRDANIENKHMDMRAGKERVGQMERVSMETYILPCVKDSQWEFSIWLGELKPELCDICSIILAEVCRPICSCYGLNKEMWKAQCIT